MYPLVSTYLHHDRTKASIVILSFKSDFAARTNEAIQLSKDLAMIAVGYNCQTKEDLLSSILEGNKTCEQALEELSRELQESVKLVKLYVVDGFEV